MIRFIILNELSVFRALGYIFLERQVCILDVCPYFKILERTMHHVMTLILAWKPEASVEATVSDMPWYEGKPANTIHTPVFSKIGNALYKKLEEIHAPHRLNPIQYAFEKAVTDYSASLLPSLTVLNWVDENRPDRNYRVYGAPTHFWYMYDLFRGVKPLPKPQDSPSRYLLNLVNTACIWIWMLISLVRQARPFAKPNRQFLLGLDSQKGEDESDLAIRVLGSVHQNALIVFRNKGAQHDFSKFVPPGVSQCVISDSRFSVAQLIQLCFRGSYELLLNWSTYGSFDPLLYSRFSVLIAKGALFSGFFWSFPVAYFWGRDEYSLDHIVRSQELRKRGGHSIGILHGIPMNTFHHIWKEIDFDTFFVPCMMLYEKCYKSHWPAHMDVRPIGNRYLTPKQQQEAARPASRDLAYFPIVHKKFSEISFEVIKIAKHFPDRRLYIKFKAARQPRHNLEYQQFLDLMPDNVIPVESNQSPYEIILKCGYVITTGGTLGLEAIQYGRPSFVFDLDPALDNFFFRNIPQCIVESGDDVIHKIESIERGRETFPFKAIATDLGLSMENFFVTLEREFSSGFADASPKIELTTKKNNT